jgi:hypothetical protein
MRAHYEKVYKYFVYYSSKEEKGKNNINDRLDGDERHLIDHIDSTT